MESHEPLVAQAERDIDDVKDEVSVTKERWDKLNTDVDEQLDKMTELNNKFKEITDKIEPIEETITCCEQAVDNLEPIGLDKEKGHDQIHQLDVCTFFMLSIKSPA